MTTPTLQIEDLKTWFFTEGGPVKAVDGVSFSISPGQAMGLVGESGSGKSITGYSILNLVDPPGKIVSGRILFKGQDLRQFNAEQMRNIRGNRIALISQDPMVTLNPVLRIDLQMTEAILAHSDVSYKEALQRACHVLDQVGIAAPRERLACYPHQLSGGMRQRIAIAIALLNGPDLIIADEPTTALDVTIQGQILYEMQKICASSGTSLIWITHDLAVVAGLADTVGVMYAGRMVEHGTTQQILESPRHPYTRALIDSVPTEKMQGQRLRSIPAATERPQSGCAFAPRCDRVMVSCQEDPLLTDESDGRQLRCLNPLELVSKKTKST